MKKRFGLRIKALAVFLIPYTLYLIPYTFAQRNNFQTYSLEQGLPQATIYCIIQDNRGYLWLGTDGGGLCRFDGITFKTYGKKEGFKGYTIRSLLQDRKGRIWAGTKDQGIIIYDGLRFTSIGKNNGLAGTAILCMYEDENGTVWAGTDDGGLNKISAKADSFKVEVIDENKGLSNNAVFDIHQDKDKHLWLATFGGVNILTPLSAGAADTFQIDQLRGGREIPSDYILSIGEDSEGALWFGTLEEGVFKIAPTKKTSRNFKLDLLSREIIIYNQSNGFNAKKVWNILTTSNKELWFASVENGIVRRRSGASASAKHTFENYTSNEGLAGNEALCVYEDNEKNIWIGTNGSGLCKFMGDIFAHYSEKDGLPSNAIWALDQDSLGNFWLGTGGGGIVKLKVNEGVPTSENYTVKNGLKGNTINSISVGKVTHNRNIWAVVADAGIAKFNPSALLGPRYKSFQNFSEVDGLLDNSAYSILVDKNGIVWVGTQQGINRFDGVKFLGTTMEKMQIDGKGVYAIIQDKNENIWFGTKGGLAKYGRDGAITTFDEMEGLMHKEIKCLAEDPFGNIWIGTSNGGVYRFDVFTDDKKKIRQMADDSMLSSNSVRAIIFLDEKKSGSMEKEMVLGTDKGVDKITFDDKGKILKVRNYNASDGFIGVECNDNAIYKDKEGNVWFGTVKGLTRYNPFIENETHHPPQIHITAIKLSNKDVDWSMRVDSLIPWFNLPDKLVLPYFENNLTFQFSAISMENPQKLRYRYMLEGLEEDWSPPTINTERDYPFLAPGKYTFKVIAAGANGIWSPQPATFTFITIKPPWYRTTWFYVLCAVIAIVSIYFYIKVRERTLIREKKILEDKVVERTAEVVKQKEELEEQKHVIEEKNKDITDSINYAQKIQSAILPDPEKIRKALPESFILFQPRDIVSGDFFWYNEVAQNGSTLYLLAAADCTGHGVPGAFMSMINTSLLNEAANEKKIHQPSEILNEVRKGIIHSLKQKGESGEQKDGMDVAIVSLKPQIPSPKLQDSPLGSEDLKFGSWVLQYAGANNSMYIIRKSNAPELEEIDPDPMPVAISDRTGDFTNHIIALQQGDTFYIFTDGYADQFGGPKGKKFKYAQFKQLLLSIQNKSMEEQKQILDKTMKEWKGALEQIDDILVMGVRV